jgi:hypothetical protein
MSTHTGVQYDHNVSLKTFDSALFEGGGWELSGGSCKLRLFTLESSPYQGEDFLLFGLLLILFPDLHFKSTIFREVT